MMQQTDGDIVRYPQELADRYRAAGLWRGRTIAQEFRAVADRFPGRPAVTGPEGVLTYAELDRQADRIAVGLRNLGVRPGDRVLLQLTNQTATVLVWYGLMKAGAVPVATLALHRRHEIVSIARQCEPVAHVIEPAFPGHDLRKLAAEVQLEVPSMRLLVTLGCPAPDAGETTMESLVDSEVDDASARVIVDEIQAGLSAEDIGVLQLSGGTTSVPKLIPRLHTEYWYNSRAWADAMEIGADSCTAHLLPVVHNAGIVCALHAAHSVGGCFATCLPDAAQFKSIARSQPITHMLLTRPIVRLVESDPELRELLRSLRVIAWADRAIPDSVIEEYESDSCRVVGMFGMGEGLCMIAPAGAPPELAHTTQGTPITEYDEVRVLESGSEEPVPPGERGELCVRGPYTIRGYFRAPERNAEAFTSDGLYRTGDIVCEVRHEGRSYYRLEDRIKDLINRGGEKINAEEVELVLLRHPAVERAAVVAMPDERLGERSCAFLVAREGMTLPGLAETKRYFDEQGVAKFKWPERVEHRTQLPLTNIHKVNKAVLRQEIREILDAERAGSRI
ncbi:AMP-binding protein [Amycolatopsis acidiphila]|uniref:AMP-binding protein n=1 Tax=Amycolatopsis acidiphila TaxID=715473 RepID=A0A558AIL0_9PSEU|nr:AMP-binding protein [Amycolatopsis acidiphila]TVT24105.1 AMP-binding protein [Amycolatopsis acidiphila]UIJ57737.1 AMP-binding protein [Amycolatopsis acidiphila]GHG87383.1 2,3-dihydroxybenzoate-AMP ligase [Amycolatopsis acidiphila]